MTILEPLKLHLIRAILEDMNESRLSEIYTLYYDEDPFNLSDEEISKLATE